MRKQGEILYLSDEQLAGTPGDFFQFFAYSFPNRITATTKCRRMKNQATAFPYLRCFFQGIGTHFIFCFIFLIEKIQVLVYNIWTYFNWGNEA